MAEVSVRELRNHTAGVVARVEQGETVVLTVHGRAVAEIRPLGGADSKAWLTDLRRRGPRPTGWLEELEADTALDLELDWRE